ncbi:MAG: glycoside hydrolase family 95 protein [Paludibacter sp.]|nr:glycoside hydrolase family 95 protein [Paludibacter sp.]
MLYSKRYSLSIFLILFSITLLFGETNEYKLWYDKPAQVWTEALPLGNGRLGAMVYGNPGTEQIQLNEATIWAGKPNNNANPDALLNIPKVRELVFAGKYLEAQTLATQKVMSQTNSGMPYQPFGDLRISFPGHTRYTDYYRELSLDSARVLVKYKNDGVTYKREIITSFTDQVVMVHLTASKMNKITFNAFLTSPHVDVLIGCDGQTVTLDGVTSTHEGLKGKVQFQGRMTVKAPGGRISCKDGVLAVEGANEATIYVSIATNFNNYQNIDGNAAERAKNYLDKALLHSYPEIKKTHTAFFKQYMDRVSLNLGENHSLETTDKRIENFSKNPDNHLVATYFQFGRYLLICSSQPGGQPANLQGLWNDKLFPSWDSKYTTNINLEMNYWPAEVTHLSELYQPLLQLTKEVSVSGKETAKIMYGADGWVLHHNTDIWRMTGAVDKAPSGMWLGGGAWLCRHLWEHYLYTGDTAFLKSVFPIIKEAARFYDQVMVKEPVHNWLVVCPSSSPENTHVGSTGEATTAGGVTMDNELITDLWSSVIAGSKILNTDADFANRLQSRLKEMAPFQIGRWGQLQEWMFDWDKPDDTHRHVSHLYGLYPSNQISPFRTPQLLDAARTSLIHRGDPSTGWSMAWKVCLWARLLDGDHAYKLITDQLSIVRNEKKQGGTYPNLFDAHPPFQIDGNFGCTAGIAEMLMQSQDGFIYILPALPASWRDGEVKGIIARGGFEMDIQWAQGKVRKVIIKSQSGGNCRLRSLTPLKGSGLTIAKGENSNRLYDVPTVSKPLINEKAILNPVNLKKTYLYDLKTEAGKVYIVTQSK